MPRSFDQILRELEMLRAEDFDYKRSNASGLERLDELTEELLMLPQPERAIPALYAVMERMPEADLGSPGALVHTLEKFRGSYENELSESIKRKPTPLAVWMLNRILNGIRTPDQKRPYLDLMRSVLKHSQALDSTKQEAQHFLQRQERI